MTNRDLSALTTVSSAAAPATWNVQVVREKVSGKCLWNACKALLLGLILMILGAAMATVGYYADHLSGAAQQLIKGNHTFKVRSPESRGLHLNNLSYAGPIIMGVGGFIVVAACVMAFEARDSAAKIVPSMRFKSGASYVYNRQNETKMSNRRTAASQTPSTLLGGPAGTIAIAHQQQQLSSLLKTSPTDRKAFTAALQKFSRDLNANCNIKSPSKNSVSSFVITDEKKLTRSPSAPTICPDSPPKEEETGSRLTSPRVSTAYAKPRYSVIKTDRLSPYPLLSPADLLKRHAVSVDETSPKYHANNTSKESLQGSQTSMAMDLHTNEYPVTLRIRDTAKRKMLTRQRPIEMEEEQGDNAHAITSNISLTRTSRRRSSNTSELLLTARRKKSAIATLERAASSDARVSGYQTAELFLHARAAASQETVLPILKKKPAHHHHHHHHKPRHQHLEEKREIEARHPLKNFEIRKQKSYSPTGSNRDLKAFKDGNRSN